MDVRLTRQNWIDFGLRMLAKRGANGLKIGALAEGLGVSRGSFYWHFRDSADFQAAILDCWRDRTLDQIIREFDADGAAPHRFVKLVKRAFFGKRELDRAIRNWATDDRRVAAIVARVDASRVDYMAKLLVAEGVGAEDARARAAFLYWAYLGQAIVMDPASATIGEPAFERIAELFERED